MFFPKKKAMKTKVFEPFGLHGQKKYNFFSFDCQTNLSSPSLLLKKEKDK
jgi:hypothetical protein